jgi:hypothetical protein
MAKKLELSVVGLQYRVTPSTRRMMAKHLPLKVKLVREPRNTKDPFAIKVVVANGSPYKKIHIGYIRRQIAAMLSPAIKRKKIELGEAWVTELNADEGQAEMFVKVSGPTKFLQTVQKLESEI